MQVENLGTDYCKVTGAHRSPLLNHILIGSSVLQSLLVCGGSVAEWLACWTQHRRAQIQIAVATLSGNSLRQIVHTHRASVHQAAKLVAALLRVARVTAGLVLPKLS